MSTGRKDPLAAEDLAAYSNMSAQVQHATNHSMHSTGRLRIDRYSKWADANVEGLRADSELQGIRQEVAPESGAAQLVSGVCTGI
jgi:hypothetical protein